MNAILPGEILVYIFRYLDSRDLLKIKLVSKWYSEFIKNNLWYINKQVYHTFLEKTTLQLLDSGKLTADYLSDLVVNHHFTVTHFSLMAYLLQNCSDEIKKKQLGNIKKTFQDVMTRQTMYLPLQTKTNLIELGKTCIKFLVKMKTDTNFLVDCIRLSPLGIDFLEFTLNNTICDITYPYRMTLLESYIQILNTERNQMNDLFNRSQMYQCLRKLAISQKNEDCLNLMNRIVLSLNLEPDQHVYLMNEVLFWGVWKKKNDVIEFAMVRGSQYDFNNNVITRLLIRPYQAAILEEGQ